MGKFRCGIFTSKMMMGKCTTMNEFLCNEAMGIFSELAPDERAKKREKQK